MPSLLHARQHARQRQIDGFINLPETLLIDLRRQALGQRHRQIGVLLRRRAQLAIQIALGQTSRASRRTDPRTAEKHRASRRAGSPRASTPCFASASITAFTSCAIFARRAIFENRLQPHR